MDIAKQIALIAILYTMEIEARAEMVKNAAKENNVKEGDLYKLLKKAGYEPTAPKGTAAPNTPPPNSEQNNNGQGDKKIPIMVSHKTDYEKYRCAGLVLMRKPENHLVTEAQAEKLKRDPWVVIGGEKKEGADK